MSDDSQWRDKYRDALSRLSAEETRRSRLQSVLRLLIGRLCLAGQGRDARLDAERSAFPDRGASQDRARDETRLSNGGRIS